jgi:hypothetical protein
MQAAMLAVGPQMLAEYLFEELECSRKIRHGSV